MGVFTLAFSVSSLTLVAAIESFFALKYFPVVFPGSFISDGHIAPVASVLAFNYTLGALFWGFVYPTFLSPLRRIAGPKSLISVHFRTLIEKEKPSGDLILDLVKRYPGEDILNLNAFDQFVLIARPRMLADLLVHKAYDFIKPPKISGFLHHVLGDGLIVIEGDQHKFMRKNTMPAFSFRHIKNLYPMMWAKAESMTAMIRQEIVQADKTSDDIELLGWASKVTLDIIGLAGMGREFNMLKKSEDPLLDVYEQLLEPAPEKLVFSMCCFIFGLSFIRLLPWHMNNVFNHLTSSVDRICMSMVRDKKKTMVKKEEDHFDILSLLIKSNNFTDHQLKDQLLTFLAAGHETTTSALTWACYLLSKDLEAQETLRQEVQGALPDDLVVDQMTDIASMLEQLPYLNGVIHETLRLYPTVPMTLRQAIRDSDLSGQIIPKGTTVVLSMWQMNRSSEVWGPEAGEFRPERWITSGKPNTNGGANSNYEFLTFLHGPRSCIGQGFAKAEMRCLLASMVRAFSWTLAMDESKVMPRGVVTIKPENGMYLNMKPLK
ncbi:cytochrome P450 [Xylariaceae sp. FL1019]|nr:cytochrome P450 [Xylariaceae sp. FL1019]